MAAKNRAYAVGSGVVLTYDGFAWTLGIDGISVPPTATFVGVWAVEDVVMVVGNFTVATNGTPVPVTYPANAVWGDRTDRMFGAARSDRLGDYTGTWQWTYVMPPGFPVPTMYEGVWGWTAEDTAIAVGRGTIARRTGTGSWTASAAPTTDNLQDVWGVSSNDFFVVGNAEAVPQPGVIYHYNNGWSANLAPPGTPGLNAIWGSAADDIFAVGEGGTILHYDGASWTPMEHSNAPASLTDVFGFETDVYTVGGGGEIWRLAR